MFIPYKLCNEYSIVAADCELYSYFSRGAHDHIIIHICSAADYICFWKFGLQKTFVLIICLHVLFLSVISFFLTSKPWFRINQDWQGFLLYNGLSINIRIFCIHLLVFLIVCFCTPRDFFNPCKLNITISAVNNYSQYISTFDQRWLLVVV